MEKINLEPGVNKDIIGDKKEATPQRKIVVDENGVVLTKEEAEKAIRTGGLKYDSWRERK
ncbi:MAG: hypothetical protein V1804_01420 [Patescibacteria group bacterium]